MKNFIKNNIKKILLLFPYVKFLKARLKIKSMSVSNLNQKLKVKELRIAVLKENNNNIKKELHELKGCKDDRCKICNRI